VRRLTSPAAGWPAFLWFAWSTGVVPVMLILPPYVFPLPPWLPLTVFDGRRVMEILWAAGLLLALLDPAIRAEAARIWAGLSRPTRAALGLFLAWALLSALLSTAPAYALREWSLFTLLLVTVLSLAAVLGSRGPKVLEIMALTLVLSGVVTLPSPLDHGFMHPRFLGQVMAVASPALLFSGSPVLALMGAPALGLGILNGSRALLLTMAVVSVAALLLWPDRRRRVLPGLLGLAAAASVVGILAWLGHAESLQEAAQRGTTMTGRETMWREAFARFLQAPVLGEGPAMLARAPGLAGWAAHPHNSVLLVAAETGIVGLGCIAVLVVQGLRRIPRLSADRHPWALALLGGGFHSLLSGTIIMPASQALLILALALVLPGAEGARPDRIPWGGTGWVLAGVGAAALIVLLVTFGLPSVDAGPSIWSPRFSWKGMIP
jgi:putative inorganic carbon (hco3(-)) transporter